MYVTSKELDEKFAQFEQRIDAKFDKRFELLEQKLEASFDEKFAQVLTAFDKRFDERLTKSDERIEKYLSVLVEDFQSKLQAMGEKTSLIWDKCEAKYKEFREIDDLLDKRITRIERSVVLFDDSNATIAKKRKALKRSHTGKAQDTRKGESRTG